MKQVVDVAFRLRAWEKAKTEAQRTGKEPVSPLPSDVAAFLRSMAVAPGEDATDDEQGDGIVRAGLTLGWFAIAGCPIVSLDDETARGFMAA